MSNLTNRVLYIAAVVVIFSAFGRLLMEIFQFAIIHLRYFKEFENYIDLMVYILAVFLVIPFGSNCWCPTNWQWQLGAIGVFLAWINLILFLKRVPLLGIYVLMFNAILQTFLKFALIAFLFVVAFGIAFYMILYKAVVVSGSGITAMRVLCAYLIAIDLIASTVCTYIMCVALVC